jgi:hypothetical protein
VKHGDLNATVPDRDKVDALTLDDAVKLLDEKAGKQGFDERRAVRAVPAENRGRAARLLRSLRPRPASRRRCSLAVDDQERREGRPPKAAPKLPPAAIAGCQDSASHGAEDRAQACADDAREATGEGPARRGEINRTEVAAAGVLFLPVRPSSRVIRDE